MLKSMWSFGFVALAAIASVQARADERNLPVLGQIWFGDASIVRPWDEVFRAGLRELGYVEGKNIIIVTRYANGDTAELPRLVNELIALPVDVLWVSEKAVRVTMKATSTIPIVCPSMGNLVREGLVESLARPGGNLTGQYAVSTDTTAKRFEFLIELAPKLKRVGVLFDANDPGTAADAETVTNLARKRGIAVHSIGVGNPDEIESAIGTISRDRAQALFVVDNPFFYFNRQAILRLSDRRYPVVSEARDWAKDGALLTYAPDFYDMFRRSTIYVDKILKGSKPGDLPIEQSASFELVVNLKTAKAFRLVVPESLLVRATEVIR